MDENIPGTCTIVDEIDENNRVEYVTVFPNPSSDYVQISFSHGKIEQIKLIDLRGRIIETQSGINNSALFNVKELIPGLYIIQIIDSKGNFYTKKVLVE